jgi:hypothetical protein
MFRRHAELAKHLALSLSELRGSSAIGRRTNLNPEGLGLIKQRLRQ